MLVKLTLFLLSATGTTYPVEYMFEGTEMTCYALAPQVVAQHPEYTLDRYTCKSVAASRPVRQVGR
jgi:hypothetical protein